MKRLLRSRDSPELRCWLAMLACASAAPLSVLLLLAMGRTTVLPISPGVSVMNEYGCCSQGLAFTRTGAQDLVSWFRESRTGFVDVLIEESGDRNPGRGRSALVTPVIQHVGSRSFKDADTRQPLIKGLSTAERIWSFDFERRLSDWRAERLRFKGTRVARGLEDRLWSSSHALVKSRTPDMSVSCCHLYERLACVIPSLGT